MPWGSRSRGASLRYLPLSWYPQSVLRGDCGARGTSAGTASLSHGGDAGSGPVRGGEDPFSMGAADVGFMCAPSFLWLREAENPSVELAGAAPVFRDDRTPGRPVYFSEVVVNRKRCIRSFVGLRGRSFAYNDPCSLSGYYNLLKKLSEMGEDRSFFDRIVCSRSHLNSLRMVAGGEVDAAAIDSNVLRLSVRSNPELRERLRVIREPRSFSDTTRGLPFSPARGVEEQSAQRTAGDRDYSTYSNFFRVRPGALRTYLIRALRGGRAGPAWMRVSVERRSGLSRIHPLRPQTQGSRKLPGRDEYRIRVGNYRIVYAVDDEQMLVEVLRVAYRRNVYRRK